MARYSPTPFTVLGCSLALMLLSACSALSRPADTQNQPVYIPPSPVAQLSSTQTAESASSPLPTPTLACLNSLLFIADKTIPDGTTVKPAEEFDKIWEVENNGTCNWDQHYRLRWIGGSELGASPEQALFPARSGTRLLIRIHFVAPQDPGNYRSAWQAFDPQGNPFGDPIYVEIIVQ
ncbi:MAG: NBR1-Ig-like domain-containing protein [Chloroflexota bacterium]